METGSNVKACKNNDRIKKKKKKKKKKGQRKKNNNEVSQSEISTVEMEAAKCTNVGTKNRW